MPTDWIGKDVVIAVNTGAHQALGSVIRNNKLAKACKTILFVWDFISAMRCIVNTRKAMTNSS